MGSPFTGPIVAQDGTVKIPAGTTPDYAAIEQMDYLVEGVVGTLPSYPRSSSRWVRSTSSGAHPPVVVRRDPLPRGSRRRPTPAPPRPPNRRPRPLDRPAKGAMPESISYERSGAGPAVVLLHPTGLGPGPLQPLADRLDADHLVIVPARRGYAPSAGLAHARSMDDHLDDLLGLLDELALPSATFVGVSGGATLLLALAIRCPERIDGGLAHEPLIGSLAPDLHAAVAEAIERMLDDPSSRSRVGVRRRPGRRRHLEPPHPGLARSGRAAGPGHPRRSPLLPGLRADRRPDRGPGRTDLVTSVGARSGPTRQDAAATLSSLGLTSRTSPTPATSHRSRPPTPSPTWSDRSPSAEGSNDDRDRPDDPSTSRLPPCAAPTPTPGPTPGSPHPHRIALVVAGADPHWIARCADSRPPSRSPPASRRPLRRCGPRA